VWPVCYIPPTKSRACFGDWKMHSDALRVGRLIANSPAFRSGKNVLDLSCNGCHRAVTAQEGVVSLSTARPSRFEDEGRRGAKRSRPECGAVKDALVRGNGSISRTFSVIVVNSLLRSYLLDELRNSE
jgi:hypothetical protein